MSRIGKQFINIPEKVKVELNGQKISVNGPKGNLTRVLPSLVCCTLDETNKKFIEENENLLTKTKELDNENNNLRQIIKNQKNEISQNKLDQKELEFLRLNLIYSSKCQKGTFKKGYKIGTPEYRKCILNKGLY